MTIGGQEAGSHHKARSRHASAKTLRAAGDVINPINVSDRIPCIVHDARRNRLLPFQIGYLPRELVNLLLQPGGLGRSVVVSHDAGADQREHSQQSLGEALPGLNHCRFPLDMESSMRRQAR